MRLLCPWNFSGKNAGAGCHFLLQGIFLTQGLNPLSPALAGEFFTAEPPGKPHINVSWNLITGSDSQNHVH